MLTTNKVLVPAIRLYERVGFVALANPVPSLFARSHRYMEWRLERRGA
ncbi:MAG TPA: hypothetical protein VLA56_10165 [Pseudomonadales bacterium]|nr:hypothetical protein [Pseudomonadales bacterium]